ncbi:hypothetical protein [Massilia rubra]|uniref:Uncharacterized protein n=1 Tax=Massilia rubra TaxID=2607910 RepID=A0ABX0LLG5_9BURK|nr:hypothetical protein [Massilia rubra]NHZ33301.1 hypothetical protein [Massilia rubra]
MPSTEINEMTQREWRELGFFYDRHDESKEWRLIGSKAGLRHFAHAMKKYASHPGNELVSEHQHFGPYGYLAIGTWTTSEITDHWIAGPLGEIQGLALTIISRLDTASSGDCIYLRRAFSPLSPYELVMEVREDSFDPAKADSACW